MPGPCENDRTSLTSFLNHLVTETKKKRKKREYETERARARERDGEKERDKVEEKDERGGGFSAY